MYKIETWYYNEAFENNQVESLHFLTSYYCFTSQSIQQSKPISVNMRFSAYVLTFTIAALSASAIHQSLPFSLKHVFSAQKTITSALELSPILVPGGAISAERITSGKISGSAVNGTIYSGFAYPSLYNNKLSTYRRSVFMGRRVTIRRSMFLRWESGLFPLKSRELFV
jgi:hypothetical protein